MTNNCSDSNKTDETNEFICGVVEGFYGRPWTTEQRKDLFQKLKKWGMDSYLYAPKDDYKHRAYWRELYTVEEAEHLTGLISAAKECGITFYYALSPGLDITYSSSKEVAILKRKLEQVSQFGCSAFALLFDDIEPEMSEADKEVFNSFANAQVSVTNEIFQHLNQPKFMVCPTQYCSARASPNVQNSEYLNTLGSKLDAKVNIMWTGTKVISRLLTSENIEEITQVLKRPPVIWDNIHANDYDHKRVFLGPYQGRSPDVIRKLRGVMINPNCEYGANFIAIHTLAQWRKCTIDGTSDILNESVSADIKLETESEDGFSEDVPSVLPEYIYHPRRALKNAILDWLPEFKRNKQAWGPISKPQPAVTMSIPIPILPSINTCMSLTPTQTTTTVATSNFGNGLSEVVSSGLLQGTNGVVIMNSLAVESKVISEPMDCNITPSDSPSHNGKLNNGTDVLMADNNSNSNSSAPLSMQDGRSSPNNVNSNSEITTSKSAAESISNPSSTGIAINNNNNSNSCDDNNSNNGSNNNSSSGNIMAVDPAQSENNSKKHDLEYEDLALMCDLFYLPFEHGAQALQLLQEFNWLKCNAHLVAASNLRRHTRSTSGEDSPVVQEWRERSKKFEEFTQAMNRLFERMTYCNNRELLYDLYPHVWDMRGVISLLTAYVKWLGGGHFESNVDEYTQSSYTWFSRGWKESFMSGDQEPWVVRGGLTADLQRLIPVDCGSDLFLYKPPVIPTSKIYTIRPYLEEDEETVYSICRKTCLDGTDGTEAFAEYPRLPCERIIGGFCVLCPEFCFVIEDETGVVGYAVAALNAKQFYHKLEVSWIPEMCEKYPLETTTDDSGDLSPTQEIIKYFHNFKMDLLPENFQSQYPSVMSAALLNVVSDQSAAKRLVVCLLAALRSNGSFGVYVPLNPEDRYFMEFYGKLGFIEICRGLNSNTVYMARIF